VRKQKRLQHASKNSFYYVVITQGSGRMLTTVAKLWQRHVQSWCHGTQTRLSLNLFSVNIHVQ